MSYIFFVKQTTVYELRFSDWSSDVCSSDLGDQNEFGGDGTPAGQRDLMMPGDCRPLEDDLDIVTFERFGIGLVEPIDLAEHIVAQHRPVEIAIGHVPAEAPGIVQILGDRKSVV